MHPNNPFSKDYDFDNLVSVFPPLKQFVFENKYGTQTITFSNKQAVKALNTALLIEKYDVIWDIPANNLCPPIPGRLDYLLHIQELVGKKEIHLLDVGTGANLIYPILAVKHFNWTCVASEVDQDSIKNAENIIENNDSLNGIDVRHQPVGNSMFVNIIQPGEYYDVTVCNPPFFKNEMDAHHKNQQKIKNLKLKENETKNFGGESNELWYRGGEEAFVIKMAIESTKFKTQVGWFTSLVSQKYNLKQILKVLKKIDPAETKIIEMAQGNKMSRIVAWRF